MESKNTSLTHKNTNIRTLTHTYLYHYTYIINTDRNRQKNHTHTHNHTYQQKYITRYKSITDILVSLLYFRIIFWGKGQFFLVSYPSGKQLKFSTEPVDIFPEKHT